MSAQIPFGEENSRPDDSRRSRWQRCCLVAMALVSILWGGLSWARAGDAIYARAAASGITVGPASSPDGMESLDDERKLNSGDHVSFRIVQDQEDPKPLIVTDSGELEVPYLGRVLANGKTCKQLARQLKIEFEKDYYFEATVLIALDTVGKSRGKVYLVGGIRSPGPVDFPGDETLTLSKAIMRAGGFSDFADQKRVRVTRKAGGPKKSETLLVNVAEIIEKGNIQKDINLEPGDVVYIPLRLVNF